MGKTIITKTLKSIAVSISKCNKYMNARVIPQPGHSKLKNLCERQTVSPLSKKSFGRLKSVTGIITKSTFHISLHIFLVFSNSNKISYLPPNFSE